MSGTNTRDLRNHEDMPNFFCRFTDLIANVNLNKNECDLDRGVKFLYVIRVLAWRAHPDRFSPAIGPTSRGLERSAFIREILPLLQSDPPVDHPVTLYPTDTVDGAKLHADSQHRQQLLLDCVEKKESLNTDDWAWLMVIQSFEMLCHWYSNCIDTQMGATSPTTLEEFIETLVSGCTQCPDTSPRVHFQHVTPGEHNPLAFVAKVNMNSNLDMWGNKTVLRLHTQSMANSLSLSRSPSNTPFTPSDKGDRGVTHGRPRASTPWPKSSGFSPPPPPAGGRQHEHEIHIQALQALAPNGKKKTAFGGGNKGNMHEQRKKLLIRVTQLLAQTIKGQDIDIVELMDGTGVGHEKDKQRGKALVKKLSTNPSGILTYMRCQDPGWKRTFGFLAHEFPVMACVGETSFMPHQSKMIEILEDAIKPKAWSTTSAYFLQLMAQEANKKEGGIQAIEP